MAHSAIAPSALATTVPCPGSVQMQHKFPEPDGVEAAEGQGAHWVVEVNVQSGRVVETGATAPNGVVVTGEMLDGAELVMLAISTILGPHGLGADSVAVELPVSIPRIHPQCWGTPDLRTWIPGLARPTLWIGDYKFGHGIVEVYENYQLMAYASGAIDAAGLGDADVDVIATIIQPRAYHRDGPIRTWRFRGDEMRAHINHAMHSAHQALGRDPKVVPGVHCRYCTARHACPTLQEATHLVMDLAMRAEPVNMTIEQRAIEQAYLTRAQAMLAARISGNDEQLLAALKAGRQVPGWRIEHGSGRRRWKLPDAKVINIVKLMGGPDISKPAEAITPLQAQAKGMHPQLIGEYSEQSRGEAKLAKDDGSMARRVFGSNA